MSITSRACRRRSRSNRSRLRTIRARPSAPSPRSTTTCACCTPASARPRCPDHGYPAGSADRQPDGRHGAGPARGQPLHAAGAGDPRAQGRARAGVRPTARAGLRARARQRRAVRDRRGAGAGPAPEAHHRSGDRPLQAARRTSSSAWPRASRPRSSSATAWPRCSRWTTPNAAPLLFSSKFSCPVCDYSLPELEPRLFSFNSPMGACPACDGLGVTQFFDPARDRRASRSCSLAAGAVRGWDRRNAYYFQLIASLAKHYGFDVDTPWNELAGKRSARRCCTAAATR